VHVEQQFGVFVEIPPPGGDFGQQRFFGMGTVRFLTGMAGARRASANASG
jgi:hypothetical protein